MKVIEVKPGLVCRARLTAAITRLSLSSAYREPLREPGCDPSDPPGLVTRYFRFNGKGRDVTIGVRLHAKAMVGLLKALRKRRSIQVTQSFDSPYSGSYRTWDQQYKLWYNYKFGNGHKAAHPCYGYHRQGRAVDLYQVTPEERAAMLSVRVDGIRFYDGLSFGDPPHFTLGAKG